jgi:membrane protein
MARHDALPPPGEASADSGNRLAAAEGVATGHRAMPTRHGRRWRRRLSRITPILLSGLQGIGLRELVTRTVQNFVRHDMGTYAAALAFSTILALFPFTIFLLGLLGAVGRADFFDWLLDQARVTLPGAGFESLAQVVSEVRSQDQGGVISIGIGLALWAASAGVRSLMTALNAAYDVPESRPPWKVYPLSIVYTIGLAVMLSLAAGLMLIGPQAATWLAGRVGLAWITEAVWEWARWPIAVLLLLLVVATVYYVGPDIHDQPFVLVTPGSVLTIVVWLGASFGFSFYVVTFGRFGLTYGSIGGVIVLLLYFFISSAVLLLGAALNAVIYHYVKARGLDTPEPMPLPAPAVTGD